MEKVEEAAILFPARCDRTPHPLVITLARCIASTLRNVTVDHTVAQLRQIDNHATLEPEEYPSSRPRWSVTWIGLLSNKVVLGHHPSSIATCANPQATSFNRERLFIVKHQYHADKKRNSPSAPAHESHQAKWPLFE